MSHRSGILKDDESDNSRQEMLQIESLDKKDNSGKFNRMISSTTSRRE